MNADPQYSNIASDFAGEYTSWGGTSGAFVELGPTSGTKTHGREYLITWGQFSWLYRSENLTGGASADSIPAVIYEDAIAGRVKVEGLPYGCVISLKPVDDDVPRLAVTTATRVAKSPER